MASTGKRINRRTRQFSTNPRAMRVLLEATQALNAAVNERDVVRALAERASTLCKADFASIGLHQGGEFRYLQQIHHADVWQEVNYALPPSGSILGRVIQTGAPYRCNDLSLDPYSDHAFDTRMGFRTQLTAPVVGGDGVVHGVVSLYNKRGGPFTDGDEALLQALAAQAAIALERGRSRAELTATVEALAQRERRFRSLVQHAADGIAVLDVDQVIRYVSPAVEQVLGFSALELLQKPLEGTVVIHPDDEALARRTLEAVMHTPARSERAEFRIRHRDGSWPQFEVALTNLLHEPSVAGIVVNLRDVSERKRAEAQLHQRAYYDDLTGLPNRALFMDQLAAALANGDGSCELSAVLFLDLDRFKVINDSLGHVAGDQLLVLVAERLKRCVRPGDTIARLGGDEFTVLIRALDDPAGAVGVANRIIAALRQPFPLHERDVTVSTSIGVALSGRGEGAPQDLLRGADIALHHAKAAGKARVAVFDDGMSAAAVARLELESELRDAIVRGELVLHYQPICDLRTGSIEGYEALVRWQHPRRGLVPPSDFIPLAEETGLIEPLGRWVLDEACREAMRLDGRLHPRGLTMCVNLSARQFAQPDLVHQVVSALKRTGLPPERLKLEITESTAMVDSERAIAVLRALRRVGVRFAIDDFGTGYSSLSYLKRLPIDTVKIDRSFVEALGQTDADAAIVRAVIQLAGALKLTVIGEGIETGEQLEALRVLGCASGQGYLLGRPQPAAARVDERPRLVIVPSVSAA